MNGPLFLFSGDHAEPSPGVAQNEGEEAEKKKERNIEREMFHWCMPYTTRIIEYLTWKFSGGYFHTGIGSYRLSVCCRWFVNSSYVTISLSKSTESTEPIKSRVIRPGNQHSTLGTQCHRLALSSPMSLIAFS